MKVYVLNNTMQEGLNTIEGYIEYPCEHNNKYTEHNYFRLQHDYSTNDYDYSDSDITEEQEEILHDKLINDDYTLITEGHDEILYNYINSALTNNRSYTPNKIKIIGLNSFKVKVWINSRGFIHIAKIEYLNSNTGKVKAEVEYMFNKKRQIKEVGYNILTA